MQDVRDDTVIVGPVGAEWTFWFVAGQILAASFAFSVLVLLSNFVAFDLSGAILSTFELWTGTIRPTVTVALQESIGLLPASWQFQAPPLASDYLVTGCLLAFADVRRMLSSPRSIEEAPLLSLQDRLQLASLLIVAIFLWPLFLLVILPFSQTHVGGKFFPEEYILWLVPLIYLGAFFAMNAIK